jgi:hypothetical protein
MSPLAAWSAQMLKVSKTAEQIKSDYSHAWAVREQTQAAYDEARITNPDIMPMSVFVACKKARAEYEKARAEYQKSCASN